MATRTREDLGSFDDIAAAAVRTTGLEDFGGTEHEEGLRLLCEDLVAHGGLTPEGNYMQRTFVKSALVGRLLSEHGFQRAPDVRRGADRATDLRVRAPAHRHHGPPPAAERRPGAPGARAVAHRGPAAAASARDLGGEPDLRRPERGVLRAPHREPRVHGDPLHGRLERGGVLADPAPVGQVDRVRVARPRSRVLRLAGEAGLDRRLRTAQGQPPADRAERSREALGAEEPLTPGGAGRDHVGLPGRPDRADPSRPGGGDRLRVLAVGRGDQGVVHDVRRARPSAAPSWTC